MTEAGQHASTAGMGSPIIVFPPGHRWQNSLIILALMLALGALIVVVLATVILRSENNASTVQLSSQAAKAESDAAYAKAKAEYADEKAKHAQMDADLAKYYATDLKVYLAEHGLRPPAERWKKPKKEMQP